MISETRRWRDWTEATSKPATEIIEALITEVSVAEIRAAQELYTTAVKLAKITTKGFSQGYKQPGKMIRIVRPNRSDHICNITSYSLELSMTDKGLQATESLEVRRYKGAY